MALVTKVRFFEVVGVSVRIHISWLPFAPLLTWALYSYFFPPLVPELRPFSYVTMAIAGCAAYFFSIALRELIRILVARWLGLSLQSITLHVFGGVAELSKLGSTVRAMLALAAAGFVANVALGAFVAGLLVELVDPATHLIVIGVGFFVVLVNWLLALVNIVPAALLGAWHVLRARSR